MRSTALARSARSDTWRTITALVGVVVATELVWLAWVHLIGVDLVVTRAGDDRAAVGWISFGVVAVTSCAVARAAQYQLDVHRPEQATRLWVGTCLGVAVVSIAAPACAAVGTSSLAGLVCLHATCAAATIAMLTSNRYRMPRHQHNDKESPLTPQDRPA